jgi:hypothetical protein
LNAECTLIIIVLKEEEKMALVKAKRGISGYGQSIGVLVLDDFYPCIPGDVRNATLFIGLFTNRIAS